MRATIFAAGMGARVRPLTYEFPTPMHLIVGKLGWNIWWKY